MKWSTSYYGNLKNIPADYLCVGISRFCPKDIEERENFIFVRNNLLAPSEDLLREFKEGGVSEEDYKKRYVEGLFKRLEKTQWKDLREWCRDIEKEYGEKYKGIVLICYEKPEDFCHRHIVAKLLTKIYGVECSEFENKKEKTALF